MSVHLLYVGDGERDARAVPRLVGRWLDLPAHAADHVAWKDIRLNRGKGYARKLRYRVAQAKAQNAHGVVATLDRDRTTGERLVELRATRDAEHAMPVAVGEAVPHGEAWLLDDLQALRETLGFPADAPVPPGADKNPKQAFQSIVAGSVRSADPLLDLISQVAAAVEIGRCRRADKTGLAAFADDVQKHLGHLSDRQERT